MAGFAFGLNPLFTAKGKEGINHFERIVLWKREWLKQF